MRKRILNAGVFTDSFDHDLVRWIIWCSHCEFSWLALIKVSLATAATMTLHGMVFFKERYERLSGVPNSEGTTVAAAK